MTEKKYSLLELQQYIQDVLDNNLERDYYLTTEISSIQENRSGHAYLEFIEKDSGSDALIAKARAIIWANTYRMLKPYFESVTGDVLSPGMKVAVRVTISFHSVYGLTYNIIDIEPEFTLGDIERKRLQVIRQLEEEGVFDMNKEAELALVPQRIAVISSETAAGYEDFINQIHNNEFGYRIITELFPALMQGNKAAESIVAAFDAVYLKQEDFDAVVLIRGGGSKSDLACFDEYHTAVNIAQFPLPVITGIGHERDISIADLVAYKNVKTPTAAAEFLIDCFFSFEAEVDALYDFGKREARAIISNAQNEINSLAYILNATVGKRIQTNDKALNLLTGKLLSVGRYFTAKKYSELSDFAKKLEIGSYTKISQKMQTFHFFGYTMQNAVQQYFFRQANELEKVESRIQALDPREILKLGYSYTISGEHIVTDASRLKAGDELLSYFHKGKIKSVVRK